MKRKMLERFLVSFIGVISLLTIMSATAFTQVPQEMNYQGYLTDSSGTPIDGTVSMEFSLYDIDTGGTALWTETQSVDVISGNFNVDLGEVNPITLPFDTQYYLGIKADADPEMTPRTALTSTGYAYRAKSVEIDSDTLNDLNCANGEVAKWNGSAWACAADVDTDTQLSEAQVEEFMTNGPLDLGVGTTLGGSAISTGTHTTSLNWSDVTSKPAGFSDNTDDDLLGGLSCGNGQVAKWNGAVWVCSSDDAGLGDGHSLDAADGDPIDAVFVDNDGNVGIGTTSPTSILHIDYGGTDNARILLDQTSASTAYDPIIGFRKQGVNKSYIGYDSGDDVFKINYGTGFGGVNHFVIDSSGSVGIGTASPGEKLEISLGAGSGNIASFSAINNTRFLISVDGVDTDLSAQSGNNLKLGTSFSGTSLTVLNSNGNVGIGTTSPGARLELSFANAFSGVNQNAAIRLLNTDTTNSNGASLIFGTGTGANRAAIHGQFDHTNNHSELQFWTMDADTFSGRMWIKNNGNVGIGTASPNAKLHIGGTAGFDGIMFPDGTLQTTAATGGGGDITEVTAGTGLTGGGTSGDVTLNVDTTTIQNRVAGTCASGSSIRVINADGTVTCETDDAGSGGDNLGDHTATQNINLNGNWLSGDGGNEGVYVDNAGNVGIGTTSPIEKLTVVGSITNPVIKGTNNNALGSGVEGSNILGNYGRLGTTDNGVYGESSGGFATDAGVHGTSTHTNGVGVYGEATGSAGRGVEGYGGQYDFYASGPGINYGASSSIRWKENIQEINNALGKILNIRGVYFDWDEEHGGQHDMGFIAEEVGEHIPEIVEYEEDGIYAAGLDYGAITPVLVQAIKELNAENEALKKEIEKIKEALGL